jgi:hypothetical protein
MGRSGFGEAGGLPVPHLLGEISKPLEIGAVTLITFPARD